jgi:hypothetical protein
MQAGVSASTTSATPMAPRDYDPDLTEQLLEEGDRRMAESRQILQELDQRLEDPRRL